MANIYQRGNVWYSDLYIDGKRKRIPLSSSKSHAIIKLGDLVKERTASKHGTPNTEISWELFKTKYLEFSRSTKKLKTTYRDKLAFDYFDHYFPVDKLKEVSPYLLENLKQKLNDAGKKPANINRVIRALKTALHKAETWNYSIPQNWQSVKLYKEIKGRLLYYTPEQLDRILTTAKGVWKTTAFLGSRAGLRRGEIYTLRWASVDFENNSIHIEPTDEWQPKDNERRRIPMPSDLKNYLQSVRTGQIYVLGDDRPSLETMSVYFKKVLKKLKLPGGIHTLRHTYASHYMQNNGNIYRLKEYLGHSSVKMTEIYAHLAPSIQDNSIERLVTKL